MRLASGGECIRTWDIGAGNVVETGCIRPHGKFAVGAVRWNHNNRLIASAGEDGKIALTLHATGETLERLEHSTKNNEKNGVNSLCFSSGSRYLVSAGMDGMVYVRDLKWKTVLWEFSGHKAAASCVCFNAPKDDHVASGSESGEILIHSMATGTKVSTLSPPSAITQYAVRAVQYSPHKRSSLGAVYDDGSVRVWDVNTGKIISDFRNRHYAPATALAFSPINKLLLVTAGLDKRILLLDVAKNTEIQCIDVPSPLSSLAIHSDGITLAVGSTTGEIMIYDLRGGSTPISTLAAHAPHPVNSLQFELPYKPSEKNKRAKQIRQPSRSQVVSSTPSASSIVSTPSSSTSRNSVISPLLSRSRSFGSEDRSIDRKSITSSSPDPVPELPSPCSTIRSIVTPESNNSNQGESKVTGNKDRTAPSFKNQRFLSQLSTSEGSQPEDQRKSSKPPVAESPQFPSLVGDRGIASRRPSSDNVEEQAKETSSHYTSHPNMSTLSTSTSTSVDVSAIQLHMEEMRSQIGQDVQNLHLDMLRQFQLQQNDVMSMLETLVEKVDQLGSENASLRKDLELLRNIY